MARTGAALRHSDVDGAPSTASAASFIASGRVGCAWQERAMSSAPAPNSIATAASAIRSPARGAEDVHAEHAVGLRVGEDLHQAVGLAIARARPLARNGNLPIL